MPLATNTSYQLQNPEPNRPVTKHAIILRLSSQALEAVTDCFVNGQGPHLDLDFGNSPALHIGGSVFPVSRQQEDNHEIYLRAPTSAKPNPPLKLHANVAGKFAVLDKDIGQNLADKIRKSTKDAAGQRSDRRTIMIDPPKSLPTTLKKRKEQATTTMFAKPVRPAPQAAKSVPSTSAATIASTSTSARPSPDPVSKSLHRRLIHLVAIEEPSTERAVRALTGDANGAVGQKHQNILNCLNEVAEKISTPGTNIIKWRLKQKSWPEVRPFEFPKIDDNTRVQLARQARKACSNLRIPESDPIWEHFKFRSTTSTPANPTPSKTSNASSSSAMGTMDPSKRSIMSSKDARDKKPKAVAVKDIPMRDEIQANSTSSSKTHAVATTPSRNSPGSGFKAPRPPPMDVTKETARAKSVARTQDDAALVSSTSSRTGKADVPIKRPKPPPDAESSRRPERNQERVNTKAQRLSEPVRATATSSRDSTSVTLKRKKLGRGDDDDYEDRRSTSMSAVKKRKMGDSDPPQRASLPVKKTEQRATPRVERVVVKREPSPSPAPSAPSRLSSMPKFSKKTTAKSTPSASRPRRVDRDHIYTSSEDEGELPQKVAVSRPRAEATPSGVESASSVSSADVPVSRPSRPLPKGRDALRTRYNRLYRDYITTYQKVCVQRGMIEQHLEGSVGSDVDGDVEMLDGESLSKLRADLRRYEGELEEIRRAFDDSP